MSSENYNFNFERKFLRKFASWTPDTQLQERRTWMLEVFPERVEAINEAIKAGAQALAFDIQYKRALDTNNADQAEEILKNVHSFSWSDDLTFNGSCIDFALAKLKKTKVFCEGASKKALHTTTSVVPSAVRHRIDELSPESVWTLVIDETGERFEDKENGKEGRIVGLLAGASLRVPYADGFHGSSAAHEVIDTMVQRVLDNEIGVLGLSLGDIPKSDADRWQTGVLELLDWVTRLLPVDKPTTINVFIENRSQFVDGETWRDAKAEIQRRLTKQKRPITLNIEVVAKDGHPLLPYVDAVAYTWGSSQKASRARLTASELVPECLMTNSMAYGELWDDVFRGRDLSYQDWAMLLQSQHPLAARILDEAGRYSINLAHYVEMTQMHLESRNINLHLLDRQMAWLADFATESLTVAQSFALLSSELAKNSHIGVVNSGLESQVNKFGKALYFENAPLVCLADLRLAVSATNRMEFDRAKSIIDPWLSRDPAIAGRCYHGRVLSSAGQVAAFSGNPTKAIEYFNLAIVEFEHLLDPAQRGAEILHTSAYRAIAEMDAVTSDAAPTGYLLQALAFDSVFDAIDALAPDLAVANQYRHHILVRYIFLKGTEAERARYVEKSAVIAQPTSVPSYHPWQLILMYNALLCEEPKTLFHTAIEIIMTSELPDIFQWMILVIDRVAQLQKIEGLPLEVVTALRKRVERRMPHLRPRFDALDKTQDVALLLHECLPFNFH